VTYAISGALQAAVFTAVAGDAGVLAVVGSDVFDEPPTGNLPLTYVVVGEEDVRGRSDLSVHGAVHDLIVSVFSDAAGFADAKAVAAAICDVLVDANLPLARGTLISLLFSRARARRGKAPDGRRIDLHFRARVDDG